ncbi:hypothetical protein GCM10008107_28600 [Psychrosphaera saromensis]|uniref:Autotransporter domain-containing protein n=1 Tax=Psychrosphaera saromensis TaxID=716813 RepID=A0A2S7USS1_9GAMM|nr:hypothetical protein [Psychrosphaera saromensis]PQJ52993.1 hypothetical protein BTO11_04525 [Psychrosphaera saromensis]GHB77380.1 hypothetical protein GCM10008107_28600 [Psychrosphaera saromensis]GLQ12845.1 hypothetical protein GCM10007917_03000 [Psychrosphaera saromensis]
MKHWIFLLIAAVSLTTSNSSVASVVLKKANKDCSKECSQKLIVGTKTFRYNYKASLQISAIYNNIEWALISLPIKNNKRTIMHYYLHSSNSRKRFSTTKMCKGLDRDISSQGEVVCITGGNVEVVGKFSGNKDKTFPLLPNVKIAVVDHYPGGVINLAYINETINEYDEGLLEYQLNVNDLNNLKKSQSSWLTTQTNLHKNSDFGDILAVNSRGDRKFSAAVYEWVNAYNKALVAYNFSSTGIDNVGKINASELHNYGFSPSVEMTKRNVTFSALNSSSGERERFSYSNTDLTKMNYEQHEFANASTFEFMFGAGFQPSFWHVSQTVDVDDISKARTKYEMNTNTLTSYYMQGRWGDSQLAVSLLQNKAKEKVNHAIDNKLIQEVVKEYVVQYDYHGLFSGASTLRLMYGSLNAGGIATYQVDDEEESEYAFESKRVIYQALVMAEKGMYAGGYYSTYNSPSMVGFADEYRDYAGVAFDKDFRLSKYGVVLGYDEGWYGSRYETDYNRWYISGEVGLGMVRLHASRQVLLDAVGTDEGDIHGKNTIELKWAIDAGYVWQRRIKSLKGLGMSVLAGYKIQMESLGQDPEDGEEDEDGGWIINYQRQDIIHGPYVKLNVIF